MAGTLIGWGYAQWKGKIWHPPLFRWVWLVLVGFLPQLASFYLPSKRWLLSDEFASLGLVFSQLLLLVFTLANIRVTGMPVLASGLACNLVVILANGGWMPLTVDAAARLVDPSMMDKLIVGARISSASKDILLPESQIILPWLADRFVPPTWAPYRFAFSLGDVFVAMGAFWMLVHNSNRQSTIGE